MEEIGQPTTQGGIGIGYSLDYNFKEAFQAAIGNIPPDPRAEGTADLLFTYEVVAIGAEIGGFAGFNHMYVSVRDTTYYPPPSVG
jgi:hypothetical protein